MSMNQERLYSVILGPHVSEKSTLMADKEKHFSFKVVRNATKPEIKEAVEKLFKVEVDSVHVSNVKGKKKFFRQMPGRRSGWKKAYVALKDGHDINFAEVANK